MSSAEFANDDRKYNTNEEVLRLRALRIKDAVQSGVGTLADNLVMLNAEFARIDTPVRLYDAQAATQDPSRRTGEFTGGVHDKHDLKSVVMWDACATKIKMVFDATSLQLQNPLNCHEINAALIRMNSPFLIYDPKAVQSKPTPEKTAQQMAEEILRYLKKFDGNQLERLNDALKWNGTDLVLFTADRLNARDVRANLPEGVKDRSQADAYLMQGEDGYKAAADIVSLLTAGCKHIGDDFRDTVNVFLSNKDSPLRVIDTRAFAGAIQIMGEPDTTTHGGFIPKETLGGQKEMVYAPASQPVSVKPIGLMQAINDQIAQADDCTGAIDGLLYDLRRAFEPEYAEKESMLTQVQIGANAGIGRSTLDKLHNLNLWLNHILNNVEAVKNQLL